MNFDTQNLASVVPSVSQNPILQRRNKMPNPDLIKQFGGKLLNIYTGAMLTNLIDIGYQVGLFEGSQAGPATSEELAARIGLQERYVREWLGAMVTSGIYTFDPASKRYALPEEHAMLLTGSTAQNLSPTSRLINHLGSHLGELVKCFRDGGGVPYSAYRPDFTDRMDDSWRRIYDQLLLPGFIGAVDGLTKRLADGIRVLDIGCGTGHAINLLAREFPNSRFFGYDLAADAIEKARVEAKAMGLANATFEAVDVSNFSGDPKFDLITAFDSIHDQRAPDAVLKCTNRALTPAGTFLMIEFKFSSHVQENIANPFAPLHYGFSVMHCMPVSLAVGGMGLGTVWGEQTARQMLSEAGFGNITLMDTPRPQNYMFIAKH